MARFHLVARGSCWVEVVGQPEPIRLEAGDLALVPGGAEHVLTDVPGSKCRTVDDVVRTAEFTGRGALVVGQEDTQSPTRLVCGHFEFDEDLHHPLLSQLPPALMVRWDEEVRGSPLEGAFRYIVREAQDGEPGHEAVVARLSETLFVQVIRSWAKRSGYQSGVLAALADPGLGAALAAMHEEPAAPWTLDALSRRAAMGRTAFTERFREVVGETPLRNLTDWRIQNAKRLLAESRLSLEQVADKVGYESAASFSRVFRRTAGINPGAYRRKAAGVTAPG